MRGLLKCHEYFIAYIIPSNLPGSRLLEPVNHPDRWFVNGCLQNLICENEPRLLVLVLRATYTTLGLGRMILQPSKKQFWGLGQFLPLSKTLGFSGQL